jgi:hypothetical protein
VKLLVVVRTELRQIARVTEEHLLLSPMIPIHTRLDTTTETIYNSDGRRTSPKRLGFSLGSPPDSGNRTERGVVGPYSFSALLAPWEVSLKRPLVGDHPSTSPSS